jgi:hypothetical protein
MPIVRMPNGDLVRFPEGTSEEEIRAKIVKKFPEQGRSTLQNVGMGLAEGAAGDLVGVGQLAERGVDYLRPGTSESVKRALPGVASTMRYVKEGSMRPTTSTAEQLGRIGGGAVLPALAVPELAIPGLGRGALAALARAAYEGGIAGGIQPTKSGSIASHLRGAELGAATGGGAQAAGRLLTGAAPMIGNYAQLGSGLSAASHLGLPHSFLLGLMLAHSPLFHLVGRLAQGTSTGVGWGVRAAPAEAIGATVGQQSGEADDSKGRDVYVHARPQ